MQLPNLSARIARTSSEPLLIKCSCPIKSSSLEHLILSESGACSFLVPSNKSIAKYYHNIIYKSNKKSRLVQVKSSPRRLYAVNITVKLLSAQVNSTYFLLFAIIPSIFSSYLPPKTNDILSVAFPSRYSTMLPSNSFGNLGSI